MTFVPRVWAPEAKHVSVHVEGTDHDSPMTPDRHHSGWWIASNPLPPGTKYGFRVDGGQPLPDPRSRRQPEGIHGPSEVVASTTFEWTDSEWSGIPAHGSIMYELHIGTFTPTGTFAGARERLPDLAALGVDLIEIMPIAPVPGTRNWGYDSVDIFAVTENYGGPAQFAAFVDAAHSHGMGVCLDVVYNHLGPDGNYLAGFGPYFTEDHTTPWGRGANLDGSHANQVRSYFIDNAMQWIRDYHVDALRLDAVAFLRDDSPRHFLAELSDTVAAFTRASGRIVSLIAESDLNDPTMITSTATGGMGMDAQWNDDLHHALHTLITKESFGYYSDFTLPGALEKAFRHVFVHDGNWSSFRQKVWGRPVPDTVSGHCFVVATETHDQVGNRALGDRPARISDSGSPDFGALAVQSALLIASPFTPMLFQGQEWATTTPFQFFTDHGPELGPAVEAGRRREFEGWDSLIEGGSATVPSPQALSTFTDSILDWDQRDLPGHREYVRFMTDSIALRKATPDLASGSLTETELVRLGDSGYLRRGKVYVVFALEPATVTVPMSDARPALSWSDPHITEVRGAVTVRFDQPGVVILLP